jgi:cell division septation protein DedD
VRVSLALPDGYRVTEVKGRPYLFDPRGILLPGPKDPALIEAYAWRHAWRQVDRELNEELVELHAGARSLHSSPRLRQYMRMLDAMGQVGREVEERPVPWRLVGWGVLAASAAAAAAVLLIAPLRTTLVPVSRPHPDASTQRARVIAFKHAEPASPAGPRTSGHETTVPSAGSVEVPRGTVRASRPGFPRFALGNYAISFGTFVNRTTADAMMHFVRSKGYIVYVARIGEEFRVVTRPYRTRAQAERLVGALQEIRLPAELTTNRNLGRLTARLLEHWSALRD